jgi:hypothetical protein
LQSGSTPKALRCWSIKALGLEPAVELRLGEKRAGQLQNLVGSAQFFDLALQLLDPLGFGCGDAFSRACIDFGTLDPLVQGLRHAANLGGNGFDGSPQGWVLPALLLHHSHCALTHLGRELVRLLHGSILSEC